MIKISKLADYGLVILSDLAAQPQRCNSAAVLAQRTGIALPTVSKILKLLNEAQVTTSSRGPNGGYRLVKNSEDLSVAEIIAAIDGVPALTECCQMDSGCIHDAHCALRSHWRLINRVVMHVLNQFTLADLKQPFLFKLPSMPLVRQSGEIHAE